MKKNLHIIVLAALGFAAVTPAGISASMVSENVQSAMASLKKAREAMPDAAYWKDKTVDKAKRMWFCFRNKSKCSVSEVNQARVWIIGVPTAIISALLIIGGVLTHKALAQQEVQKEKDKAEFFRLLVSLMRFETYRIKDNLKSEIEGWIQTRGSQLSSLSDQELREYFNANFDFAKQLAIQQDVLEEKQKDPETRALEDMLKGVYKS